MLKRIFSIFAIALIITGLFFEGYSLKCPVYADDTTDGWFNVTTNEQLVEAFKYYCKSRDLTIEGSVADAVTSFTTKTFNGICNTLGIDITALQGQLKYKTDGNLGAQFLFTTTGIEAYNRIFSQFLQDNELEVGDSVEDQTLYDGKYVDGYLLTLTSGWGLSTTPFSTFRLGSVFMFSNSDLVTMYNNGTTSFSYGSKTANFWTKSQWGFNGVFINTVTNTGGGPVKENNTNLGMETPTYCTLAYNVNNGNVYYGMVGVFNTTASSGKGYYCQEYGLYTPEETVQNTVIYMTTNNSVINNNTYEGDTIINNDGDIINNNPDNPDNPDLPPSNPTVPDSGGWQDFQMPTMPNDWLIYGMEKKFPFDIPFNIMFGLSLLNHEPEIPKFEGDIDLKVCTWHYNIDLTPFDDIAKILRKFEVLAFIIGLAILTKELIMWG